MPYEEAVTVAKRLKMYREAVHHSQFEAAEEIGISVEELSNLERCCTDPRLSTLRKTANYMGISVAALLTPESSGTAVFGLLHYLGITPKYSGYFQTAQAVELCIEVPDRLTLITKLVYAEVGKRYGVNWMTVERNIRTVAKAAWRNSPGAVEQLMGAKLSTHPKNVEFITALAAKVKSGDYSFLSG